jgi:hypothetical protein
MITFEENGAEVIDMLSSLALRAIDDLSKASTFTTALHQAIDTTFIEPDHGGRTTSLGMHWLHQYSWDLPTFMSFFQEAVGDPAAFFLQHNEYNASISDISCSKLLALIPAEQRASFVRAVVLRWGPHCKRWTRTCDPRGRFASSTRRNLSRTARI